MEKRGEITLTTDDIKDSSGKSVASLMGEMAKKDGSLQANLNAEKINGKTAALTPLTVNKTDIIGMVNELFNKKIIIKNEDTNVSYYLKLDNNGLYLQEV